MHLVKILGKIKMCKIKCIGYYFVENMLGYRAQGSRSAPSSFEIHETDCGPLCQHPGCWQSTNRRLKNIPKCVPRPPSPEDYESGNALRFILLA